MPSSDSSVASNLIDFWMIGIFRYPNMVEVGRQGQNSSGPDAYLNFVARAKAADGFTFVAASEGFGANFETEMRALKH